MIFHTQDLCLRINLRCPEKRAGMEINMNTKISAQIKKGVLEMCLLHKLSQQDYYGYNLMHEMNILFPEVNSSTFYAILRRLKNDGFADIYYGNESGGPTRKYYKITDNGKETLAAYIEEWEQLKSVVSELGI